MNVCPQHHNCIWYAHHPDNVGADLGYGDGFANAKEFTAAHAPMASEHYPVSNGRGDLFALGFMSGAVAGWCPKHVPADGCFGNHSCKKLVDNLVSAGSVKA